MPVGRRRRRTHRRRQRCPGRRSPGLRADAKANGDGSTAIGDETTATGKNTTAVGSWIDLDADGLVDPNEITWANGDNATAIGAAAQALGKASTVLGVRAVANLDNSVAIGNQAQTQAVGTSTVTTREGAARTGTGTVVTTNPSTSLPASGSNSIAMGNQARVNGNNSIVIGPSASAEKISNSFSVAASPLGSKETQTTTVGTVSNTVVIGNASRANGDGITVIGAGALAEAYTRVPLNGFGGPYVVYQRRGAGHQFHGHRQWCRLQGHQQRCDRQWCLDLRQWPRRYRND